MDVATLAIAINVSKSIPGTAAQRAESAADRAEAAADTVTSATVAETKTYLGIN